ncbi:rod shape-determining protein MreC [bacterium]|nr:rod shape-determining protein MreC [bacterium]
MLKKRGLLVLILAFLIVLFFQVRQEASQTKSNPSFIDRILVNVLSPVTRALRSVRDGVVHTWDHYFWLVGVKDENKKLQETVDLQNLFILSLKERLKIKDQEARLDQSLHFMGYNGVVARVTAYDANMLSQSLWVDAGTKDGVMVDMPVIALKGLVGRIIKAFDSSSMVLLMTDPHFAVDVVDEQSRIRAMVVGNGRSPEFTPYPIMSHLEYLQMGYPINKGDLLLTSGLGDLYPKGIPVGNVVADNNILPMVDFNTLEEVIVITGGSSK